MPGRAETSRNGQLTPHKVEEGRPLWDGTFVGTWWSVTIMGFFVTQISKISNFTWEHNVQR